MPKVQGVSPKPVQVCDHQNNWIDVKPNQVWKTNEGNLALIVHNFQEDIQNLKNEHTLKMLWFDKVDKDFCVSELFTRLNTLTKLTPAQFFQQFAHIHSPIQI